MNIFQKAANTTGTYTKLASDLPPDTNPPNLFDGANAIGAVLDTVEIHM